VRPYKERFSPSVRSRRFRVTVDLTLFPNRARSSQYGGRAERAGLTCPPRSPPGPHVLAVDVRRAELDRAGDPGNWAEIDLFYYPPKSTGAKERRARRRRSGCASGFGDSSLFLLSRGPGTPFIGPFSPQADILMTGPCCASWRHTPNLVKEQPVLFCVQGSGASRPAPGVRKKALCRSDGAVRGVGESGAEDCQFATGPRRTMPIIAGTAPRCPPAGRLASVAGPRAHPSRRSGGVAFGTGPCSLLGKWTISRELAGKSRTRHWRANARDRPAPPAYRNSAQGRGAKGRRPTGARETEGRRKSSPAIKSGPAAEAIFRQRPDVSKERERPRAMIERTLANLRQARLCVSTNAGIEAGADAAASPIRTEDTFRSDHGPSTSKGVVAVAQHGDFRDAPDRRPARIRQQTPRSRAGWLSPRPPSTRRASTAVVGTHEVRRARIRTKANVRRERAVRGPAAIETRMFSRLRDHRRRIEA